MRFLRVRLENWRNFTDVDLALEDRVFIFGANASGKSNLLDAFRFLHDVAADGLDKALNQRRGGLASIRSLAARMSPNVAVDVEVGNGGGRQYRYRLELKGTGKLPHQVVDECVWGTTDDDVILKRPDKADGKDPELLKVTHLEQLAANGPFRELADFFKGIRYHNAVPQIMRESDAWRGARDSFGADLLEQLNKLSDKKRRGQLNVLLKGLRAAVPQFEDIEFEKDDSGRPHLRAKYSHWRPQGAWQRESSFSDGTLRLLGILWGLMHFRGVLLLEEPEISLHGAVVAKLPALLRAARRKTPGQVILTSNRDEILTDAVANQEVVMLKPGKESTVATLASNDPDLAGRKVAAATLRGIVRSETQPKAINSLDQLDFGL